jgi:hypothetical protein
MLKLSALNNRYRQEVLIGTKLLLVLVTLNLTGDIEMYLFVSKGPGFEGNRAYVKLDKYLEQHWAVNGNSCYT